MQERKRGPVRPRLRSQGELPPQPPRCPLGALMLAFEGTLRPRTCHSSRCHGVASGSHTLTLKEIHGAAACCCSACCCSTCFSAAATVAAAAAASASAAASAASVASAVRLLKIRFFRALRGAMKLQADQGCIAVRAAAQKLVICCDLAKKKSPFYLLSPHTPLHSSPPSSQVAPPTCEGPGGR